MNHHLASMNVRLDCEHMHQGLKVLASTLVTRAAHVYMYSKADAPGLAGFQELFSCHIFCSTISGVCVFLVASITLGLQAQDGVSTQFLPTRWTSCCWVQMRLSNGNTHAQHPVRTNCIDRTGTNQGYEEKYHKCEVCWGFF
jgi:hypothetical protein